MAFAKVNGHVVLTHDLDFGAILAATQGDKPSVVQIRSEDVSPEAIGGSVVDALRQMAAELNAGALLTVEPNRIASGVTQVWGRRAPDARGETPAATGQYLSDAQQLSLRNGVGGPRYHASYAGCRPIAE